MKAKLIHSGADRESPHEFSEAATIGRSAESTIRLDSEAVSTEHARIWFDREIGRYRLEDLGSLNGTKLDGVVLTRAEPLDRLHVLEFGGDGREYVLQVIDVSSEDEEPAPAQETPAAERVAAATGTSADQEMPELPAALAAEDAGQLGSGTSVDREMPALPENLVGADEAEETLPIPPEKLKPGPKPPAVGSSTRGPAPYYLQLHDPPDSEPHPLHPGNRVVGRARSADVTVESRAVSRRHAMLSVTPERVTVQDLGSRNQTFVADRVVTEPTEVKPGEIVRFGELAATLLAGEPAE